MTTVPNPPDSTPVPAALAAEPGLSIFEFERRRTAELAAEAPDPAAVTPSWADGPSKWEAFFDEPDVLVILHSKHIADAGGCSVTLLQEDRWTRADGLTRGTPTPGLAGTDLDVRSAARLGHALLRAAEMVLAIEETGTLPATGETAVNNVIRSTSGGAR